MTPERWNRVKEIFQAAIQQAPAERSVFVSSACGDDEPLLREVESLIASHDKSGEFIDTPAFAGLAGTITDNTPELRPGQTVGAFEIVSFLSRGGMGEIFVTWPIATRPPQPYFSVSSQASSVSSSAAEEPESRCMSMSTSNSRPRKRWAGNE